MHVNGRNGRLVNLLLIALVIVGLVAVFYVIQMTQATPAVIAPNLSQIGAGQTASITVSWTGSGGAAPYTVYLYQGTSSSSCGTTSALASAKAGLPTPGYVFNVNPISTSYYCGTVAGSKGSSAVSSIVSVTVTPILDVPTLSLSAPGIDTGQSLVFTASVGWTGGVSPFSVTLYRGANSTCSLDTGKATLHSGLNPQVALTGRSTTFSVADPVSTSYYCATVTDSATSPHTLTSLAAPFMVSGVLDTSISPPAPVVDIGQSINLTAIPIQGTSPFSFQWFTGVGCSSGEAISGATKPVFDSGPIGLSFNYSVLVHDGSQGTPAQSVCTNDVGKVNPKFAETLVTVTPLNVTADSGFPFTLTVSWGPIGSGVLPGSTSGTVPYTVTLTTSNSTVCQDTIPYIVPKAGLTRTTTTFTINSTSTIKPMFFCATVVDSATVPVSTSSSVAATLTVNPIFSPTLALSPPGIDLGQSVTVNATVTFAGGSPPYSATLTSGSSKSCSSDSTVVAVLSGPNPRTGVAGYSTTFRFKAPTSSTIYCVSATDGTGVPASTGPVSFPVSALPTVTITPSSPAVDSGQLIVLTANPLLGTTPYTFQWYTGLGCVSANAISRQTAQAYSTPKLTSSANFSVLVGDSGGGTPVYTVCVGTAVQVNSALDAPVIVLSPSAMNTGESATIKAKVSWSGGTSPYIVTLNSGSSASKCSADNTAVTPVSGTGANPQTVTTTSATVTFSAPSTSTYYCATVKDGSVTPVSVTTSSPVEFVVNAALSTPSIVISPTVIDVGQTLNVTASVTWSGGTSPYTVALYSGASSTCSSNTLVAVLPDPNPQSGLTVATTNFSVTAPASTTDYCAVVTDSSAGSASTASPLAPFTVNPVLTATISPPSAAIDAGQSVAVTLTAVPSGGTSPYQYQWYAGASCSSGAITGQVSSTYSPDAIVSTTTYSVSVKDSSTGGPAAISCTSAIVKVDTALSVPADVLSPSEIDTGQSAAIAATVTWSGGTSPYAVTLYSGTSTTCSSDTTVVSTTTGVVGPTTTFNFNAPTSTTEYCVSVKDSATVPVTTTSLAQFTVDPALNAAISPASPHIDSGQSITLTAVPSQGTQPYPYQWYTGSGCAAADEIPGATSSTYMVSPTSTASYSVKVTDSSIGSPTVAVCASAAVSVSPVLSVAISPVAPLIDSGQSITLTALPSGGFAPYHYQWYKGSSCSVQITGQDASTFTTNALASTTSYAVFVGDNSTGVPAAGACLSVKVTVNSAFTGTTVTISSSSAALDSGQPVTLTVSWTSSGTSPYSVKLTTSSSATCSNPSSTGLLQTGIVGTTATFTDVPLSTTNYCAMVTDGAVSGESASTASAAAVTVKPALVAPTLVISPPAIDSGQSATVTATVTWSGGTSPYTVELYSGPSSSCSSDTTAVVVSGYNPELIPTGTSTTFSFASPGSSMHYCATVTDSPTTPVKETSQSANFTVNSALTVTVSPSSPKIDSGQSITLTALPSQGTLPYHYQWYTGLSCGSAISGAATSSYSTGVLTSGANYSVLVSDSSLGTPHASTCVKVTVAVNPVLSATISPASPTLDSGQSITLTALPSQGTSPYYYQWYTGLSCAGGSAISGAASSSYSTGVLNSGATYSVQVSDSSAGTPGGSTCAKVTVAVNPALTAAISPASPTIDEGQSVALNAVPSQGTQPYHYQWYIGSSCAPADKLGQTTSSYTASPTITSLYSVNVTDSGVGAPVSTTCVKVTVTVNSVLTATISPASPAIDTGQSIVLNASAPGGTAPYTYQWYSGTSATCSSDTTKLGTAPTQSVSPTSSTYYCYVVKDSSKGTPAASATSSTDLVTVNPVLTAPAISVLNATLPSGRSTSLSVTTTFSGGTSTYMCQWLVETPGSSSFVDMAGSPFTCTSATLTGLSTGALTPTGTYSFKLEVTDSAYVPVSVYSNTVTVLVS